MSFLKVLSKFFNIIISILPSPKPIQQISPAPQPIHANYFFKPTRDNCEVIKALLFLGKADGQLRENELAIIVNFLTRIQPEHADTPYWYLLENIKQMRPFEVHEYQSFIQSLNYSGKKNFMAYMQEIFGTQKKNHPYEDILIKELEQEISGNIIQELPIAKSHQKSKNLKCIGCDTPIPENSNKCPMCWAPVSA